MIRAAFFDLDNTLYPSSADMENHIIKRMNEYTSKVIGKSVEETSVIRKTEMKQYGTTLEWLMNEYHFDEPVDYYEYVHPDFEKQFIDYDPNLRPFLEKLPVPLYVFSNAPMAHVERVLKKLDIYDLFTKLYDIWFNNLKGKPSKTAVEKVLKDSAYPANETIFFDDVPRYVQGFIDCGGKGVLIDANGKYKEPEMPVIKSIYEISKFFGATNV